MNRDGPAETAGETDPTEEDTTLDSGSAAAESPQEEAVDMALLRKMDQATIVELRDGLDRYREVDAERVATIGRLQKALEAAREREAERVATIERLQGAGERYRALDVERLAANQRLQMALDQARDLDAQRLATIARLQSALDNGRSLDAERLAANNRLQAALDRTPGIDADRLATVARLSAVEEQSWSSAPEQIDDTRTTQIVIDNDRELDAHGNATSAEVHDAGDAGQLLKNVLPGNQKLLIALEEARALDRDRVAAIGRLQDAVEQGRARDADRVATIERLQAALENVTGSDDEHVAAIGRLTEELDAALQREAGLEQMIADQAARFSTTDGISVASRNLSFLEEPRFAQAWAKAKAANVEGWPGAHGVPDIRWRAHVALWAARQGLGLEGDFVECGVHTGLLSLVILHSLDLQKAEKSFFLFDTFHGIPLDRLEGEERVRAKEANDAYYGDVWSIAQRNFAPFAPARLVQGELPASLADVPIKAIAFLSIDLNNAISEMEAIEVLWGRVTPGAIILLDDYAWVGHEPQHEAWNRFAAAHNLAILTLPTGQGLLVKPLA